MLNQYRGGRIRIQRGDFLKACMASGRLEREYECESGRYPDSCYVNQPWNEIVSPARTAYRKEDGFWKREERYPEFRFYYPQEGERVEYSGFFMRPTVVDFAAEWEIEVKNPAKYPFRLFSCSAVKIDVNGERTELVNRYERNQEYRKELLLPLRNGRNRVRIMVNDLAERDTQFYIRLQYLGEEPVETVLPEEVDLHKVEELRQFLDGISLEYFNYRRKEDIRILLPEEIPESCRGVTCQVEAEFMDGHTKSAPVSRNFTLENGMRRLQAGDLLNLEVGMVQIRVSAAVGPVEAAKPLELEYYSEELCRDVPPSGIEDRKKQALRFLAKHGRDTLQKALAMLVCGQVTEEFRSIVEAELERVEKRFDSTDFRMPALLMMLQKFGTNSALAQYRERMKNAVLGYRYWFDEPGNDAMWFFSENHAVNFHASEYLAGEMYPDEFFLNTGMTGRWHAHKAKGLLNTWFEDFFKYGFNEWNSSVYLPIDVIAFTALYEMAQDEDIKIQAKRALDRVFEIFAVNSFRGVMASSYGRAYFKNLIGRRTAEASALNYIVFGEGFLNQHCFSAVLLALSSYEAPEETARKSRGSAQGLVTVSFEGKERVRLYSCKRKNFIMCSAPGYRPGQPGLQEHMMQVMAGDCDTQIWINHPGEKKIFGSGRPSYFAGNGTIPDVRQEENRISLIFDLPEQEVDFTHAFCPLNRFQEVRLEADRIFLRKDEVYLCIYARGGIQVTERGPLKNCELISCGRQNVWTITADDSENYGSFEEFINKEHGYEAVRLDIANAGAARKGADV